MPEEDKNKAIAGSSSQLVGESVSVDESSSQVDSQSQVNQSVLEPVSSQTENIAVLNPADKEEEKQTPSVYINSVSDSSGSFSEGEKKQFQDKKQRTLLFLALFLFIASIVGLAFYFASGWKEGRLSGKLTTNNTSQPTEAPQEVTPTPLATSQEPTLDWKIYSSGIFIVKYPQDFVVSKEDKFLVFENSQKEVLLKLEVLPVPGSGDLTTVFFDEIKKIDSKITFDKFKKSLTLEEGIGPYQLISYKSGNVDDVIFSIFEDSSKEKAVFVLDYSLKLGEEKYADVVKEMISTFEFVNQLQLSLTPSASPSASPSGKFDVSQ